jgi:hypothetical protein
MEPPKTPGEGVKNAADNLPPNESPVTGTNVLDKRDLPSEPPTTIDLVRRKNGELAIIKMQNGRGHSGASVTHNHRIYRIPDLMGTPFSSIPLPHQEPQTYASSGELFQAVNLLFKEHASCSEPAARLLTYWVLATWFTDCFALAPCLVITGPPWEADLLLLLLSYVCRFPLLLAAIGPGAFGSLPMEFTPTLLLREPELNKRMASLLRASTRRSYLTVGSGGVRDLYCAKAVYVGEHGELEMLGPHTIHLEVTPNSESAHRSSRLPSWQQVLALQDRLFNYRMACSARVVNSDFDVAFAPDIRAVAQVLGACILDDPKLRAELVPLLAPHHEQRLRRRSDLESIVLNALLLHCHEEKGRIFVREITQTVNQIYKDRGERLEVSAEEVGHKLKSLGLFTRRLGSGGRGLELDQPTQALVHERADAQQLLSPDETDEGCQHCQRLQVIPEEGIVHADGRS